MNQFFAIVKGNWVKQRLEDAVEDFQQLLREEGGAILHVKHVESHPDKGESGTIFSRVIGMKLERHNNCAFLIREILKYYRSPNCICDKKPFEVINDKLPVATFLIDDLLFILVGLEREKGLACLLAIAQKINLITEEGVQRLEDNLAHSDPLHN